MSDLLQATLAAITDLDEAAMAVARQRQNQLTKPPGSLGVLEDLSVQLAGIAATCPPPVPQHAVIGVFAGDHGVCAQGVSPWPQEVTVLQLVNMAAGQAAITVLARAIGATVMLTDVGVAGDYEPSPNVRTQKVRRGTADLSVGPAMSHEEAVAALEVGIRAAQEAIADGAQCLMTGDMGIANTTPSSALIAAFTGLAASQVTGRGAGAGDEMLTHKTSIVADAVASLNTTDPLAVLASVGGLEQAAIAGFMLGGAAHRVPVILDGVIGCAAACVAAALKPGVRGYLIAGHAGVEPGIRAVVEHLGLTPLLSLNLRLGEGSGAALAYPIVQASARILAEMATFAEAGITNQAQ